MSSDLLIGSAYLPNIYYFQHVVCHENVTLDANEFFVKQTARNRTYIAVSNGILPLIIPIKHQSKQHTPMKDVCISNDTNWQKIHWKSIESAYRNSPFFEYYEDYFRNFYTQKFDLLFEFNLQFIHKILDLLKIKKDIKLSTEYIPKNELNHTNDFRNSIYIERKKIPDYCIDFPYQQVFTDSSGFLPNLSIVDLLSNKGPHSLEYLQQLQYGSQQ